MVAYEDNVVSSSLGNKQDVKLKEVHSRYDRSSPKPRSFNSSSSTMSMSIPMALSSRCALLTCGLLPHCIDARALPCLPCADLVNRNCPSSLNSAASLRLTLRNHLKTESLLLRLPLPQHPARLSPRELLRSLRHLGPAKSFFPMAKSSVCHLVCCMLGNLPSSSKHVFMCRSHSQSPRAAWRRQLPDRVSFWRRRRRRGRQPTCQACCHQ